MLRVCSIAVFAFFQVLTASVWAQVHLDPDFKPLKLRGSGGGVASFLPLPNGNILIGGYFHISGGLSRSHIAQLHPDATTDPEFISPFLPNEGSVTDLAVYPDGRILAAGEFAINPVRYPNFRHNYLALGLVRLVPDGRPDPTFKPQRIVHSAVLATALLPDGRVLCGGNTTAFGDYYGLGNPLRLLSDSGIPDTSQSFFNYQSPLCGKSVCDLLVLPDSSVLVASNIGLFRWVPDSGWSRFGTSAATKLFALPDGKILICHSPRRFGQDGSAFVIRLLPDGQQDPDFQPISVAGDLSGIDVTPNGAIFIAVADLVSEPGPCLRKFSSTGQPLGFLPLPDSIARQSAGGLLASQPGGILFSTSTKVGDLDHALYQCLWRTSDAGHLDLGFDPDIANRGSINKLVLQPDGKPVIIFSGRILDEGGRRYRNIARLNFDGTVDRTFQFQPTPTDGISDCFVQPDGKIVVVGGKGWPYPDWPVEGCTVTLVRLLPDGTPDPAFRQQFEMSGYAYSVSVDPHGRILFGGSVAREEQGVIRVLPDGRLDDSFNTRIGSATTGRIFQWGNKMYVWGGFSIQFTPNKQACVIRLSSDGSLDRGFQTNHESHIGSLEPPDIMAVLPDGGAYVDGFVRYFQDAFRVALKLLPNGELDPAFSAPWIDGDTYALTLLGDTTLVTSSVLYASDTAYYHNKVFHLLRDGAEDPTFTYPGGWTNSRADCIKAAPDSKLYLGGEFTEIGNDQAFGLVRLVIPVSGPPPDPTKYVFGQPVTAGPNPASSSVRIKNLLTGSTIAVSGLDGRPAAAATVFGNEHTLNVSDLPPGVYQIRMTTNEGEPKSIRLLIAR